MPTAADSSGSSSTCGDALGDELRDALADAVGELAGRLAGEGESEHLGHVDVAVREQPDDAVRHGLGLAAARTGDDDARAERIGLDHRALLGRGRVQPEPRGDLVRPDACGRAVAGLMRTPPARGARGTARRRSATGSRARRGPRTRRRHDARDLVEALAERRLGVVVERLLGALGEREPADRTGHVDELRTAQRSRVRHLAVACGELVGRELRMRRGLRGGRRRAPRLQVDDDGGAVGRRLDPVDRAGEPHPFATSVNRPSAPSSTLPSSANSAR